MFYHGSYSKGIKTLLPFSKSHNTIKKPVVYLTPNINLAQFYIWNRSYKLVTFHEQESGLIVYTEWYANQLFDLYHGLSGSVYKCEPNDNIYLTHIQGVYNSDVPVAVFEENEIPDVYENILKKERDGKILIKHFEELSENDKSDISLSVIRGIHMTKSLDIYSDNPLAEEVLFYKEKFHDEWEFAQNMKQNEIDAMILKWRSSLK